MPIKLQDLSFYYRMSKHELRQLTNIVYSYGICSCFLLHNKNMRVTPLHIKKLIDDVYNEKTTGAHTRVAFLSDDIKINFISHSNKVDKEKLLSMLSHPSNKELIKSICDNINSVGVSDVLRQCSDCVDINTSVVDVSITVDGNLFKKIKISHMESLPTGGIGKSELENDYGYNTIRSFIKSIFSVDIGSDSSVYYNEAHNLGTPTVESMESAVRLLFKQAEQKISQGLNGAYDTFTYDFRENMWSNVLRFYCNVDFTLTYEYVNISDDMMCSTIDPFKIKQTLYYNNVHVYCPQSGNPSLRVSDEDGLDLFYIRFKKESYPTNTTGYRYKLFFVPVKIKEYLL